MKKTSEATTKSSSKIPRKARQNSEGSVFDRLYKTKTISSSTRKITAPVVTKCILAREDEIEKHVVISKKRRQAPVKPSLPPPTTTTTRRRRTKNSSYLSDTISSSSKTTNTAKESSRRGALKPKNSTIS